VAGRTGSLRADFAHHGKLTDGTVARVPHDGMIGGGSTGGHSSRVENAGILVACAAAAVDRVSRLPVRVVNSGVIRGECGFKLSGRCGQTATSARSPEAASQPPR
jgi:hypothetical protein